MNKSLKKIKFSKKIIVIFMTFIYFSLKSKYIDKTVLNYPPFLIQLYKKYFDSLNQKNSFDLFKKENKIENIFILIAAFPFIKKEIILSCKSRIYESYKEMLNIKNKGKIFINRTHKQFFMNKSSIFKNLVNYIWESLPNINKTNYIRYILYNYYNFEYLSIFEQAMNKNIKHYLNINKRILTIDNITNLLSKK